ncbi:DUF2797 domain-containing protein [Marinibactrum halimedae]|uniref:DUF2797 domain-containing protein n=1 Tax=Marinibactrum halimedae TaxID=1444977 RepID=A0AA37T623_9GAMM|nr:DUF2797 domain-containing protein [Marinibactrum halimedae]MCD9459494.1 DUF2797 domain-containing protein [Marinibactrum halimedae]GLS28148.1 hypothetical protein GCM10007877_38670 [Marinibactrum halimedae]
MSQAVVEAQAIEHLNQGESVVGFIEKMAVSLDESNNATYALRVNDRHIDANTLIGQHITLEFMGAIECVACGRKTKKSFSQGHCYPCMKKLARCDQCIVSPEKCHYHLGTCREPEWGEQFCMTDHIVYLANTSGAKVGITRASQIPTRWIDQGATQALPILRVATRQLSGLIETALKADIADKTNWRTMLKGNGEDVDLLALKQQLLEKHRDVLAQLRSEHGDLAVVELEVMPVSIHYPVKAFPKTIKSFNLDKDPVATGCIQGIKGQYLLLDTGVINLRKYTGYQLKVAAG